MEMVMTIVVTSIIAMVAGYLLTFGVKNAALAPKLAHLDSIAGLFLERISRDLKRIYPLAGQGFSGSSNSLTLVTNQVESITYYLSNNQIIRTAAGESSEAILDNVSLLQFSYFDVNGNSVTSTSGNVRLIKINLGITLDGITRNYQTSVFPTNWRLSL